MENEIVQVAVQEGLLSWLSTIGVLAAVFVAILLPFVRDRIRENKNARAIKNEACLYLDTLKSKLNQINKNGGVERTGMFEEDNKKNFDALEIIYRSAASLEPRAQSGFREFITFFKTCDNIKQSDLTLVYVYLSEITKLQRLLCQA